MKNTSILLTLISAALCAGLATTASANHRSGDFPLPEIMAGGDFNHDGNIDLAVNLSGFDNFAVLTGDGAGNFTIKRHVEEDTLPKAVVAGDINNDGQLDVVAVAQWGYNVKTYLGDGAGGFEFSQEINGDGEPNRLRLADLNKDGNLDIVYNAPLENKLIVFFGIGNGRFSQSGLELERYPNIFGIRVADLNKDGNLDIAITYFENISQTGSHLQILLGDGAGNFTVGQNVIINSQCNNVEFNDLNKDGNLDIILAGAGAENDTGVFISTYLGDGAGNFAVKQILDLGTGSIKGEIGVGDFNEDGNIDVAFPLSSNGGQRGDFSTDLLMFFGDNQGNFTQGQTVTVGKEPGSTFVADFNKDGHLDIAETNRTDGTLSVLLGNGNGTFTTHATIPLNAVAMP